MRRNKIIGENSWGYDSDGPGEQRWILQRAVDNIAVEFASQEEKQNPTPAFGTAYVRSDEPKKSLPIFLHNRQNRSIVQLSGTLLVLDMEEAVATVLDKGKPVARRGRKAMGSYRPMEDG